MNLFHVLCIIGTKTTHKSHGEKMVDDVDFNRFIEAKICNQLAFCCFVGMNAGVLVMLEVQAHLQIFSNFNLNF